MTRSGAVCLSLLLTLAAGCGAAVRQAPPTAGQATQAAWPPPRKEKKSEHRARWREQIRNKRSIPELWTAINYHQDALGRALHADLAEPRDVPPRRIAGRPPRRPTIRPTPPTPPEGARVRPRPADTGSRQDPVCRRACRHVQAICYAARRICRIAHRLGEYPALTTCERARERCEDARRVARRRCGSCR